MRPVASIIQVCLMLTTTLPSSQLLASDTPPFRPSGTMARGDLPPGSTWNLAPLFADDDAAGRALDAARKAITALGRYRGKLASPKELAACLALYFDTRLAINKLTLYASMRFDTAQSSPALQAQNDRALGTLNDFMTATTFIRQEVLALSDRKMAAAYKAEPKLRPFEPYVRELRRRRAHLLSADAERALALAGDNLWAEIDLNEIPSDHQKTFGAMLTDLPLPQITDEAGKKVTLTLASLGKYRGSSNRQVRRDAVESFFASLRQYQHAFASTLSGQINFNVFLARARGYPTALDAYLDKDNIDTAVYKNLIASVRQNLAPLRAYLHLRKQAMGLEELHVYDLYAPLAKGVTMDVPYSEARRILPEALAPLGKEYLATLEHSLDPQSGWIDIYPHQDKRSGAFSSSVFGIHPYVKMNYFAELDDLSTLAHEYGHALHSQLAMTTQPYVTFNYVPFVAEIASTCNEKLLSDYLVAHAKSDAEKLYILAGLLETIRTTIYRQTLFAEFELRAHTAAEAGTPLTADFLNALYKELLVDYYGPELTMGPNDEVEWAYIPHFYYKYYMYSYATGLSSGIALADRVQRLGAPAVEAYLGMLKGGRSKPPLELLKGAGVDLTKPTAIEAAARLMQETIDAMRPLLAKKS